MKIIFIGFLKENTFPTYHVNGTLSSLAEEIDVHLSLASIKQDNWQTALKGLQEYDLFHVHITEDFLEASHTVQFLREIRKVLNIPVIATWHCPPDPNYSGFIFIDWHFFWHLPFAKNLPQRRCSPVGIGIPPYPYIPFPEKGMICSLGCNRDTTKAIDTAIKSNNGVRSLHIDSERVQMLGHSATGPRYISFLQAANVLVLDQEDDFLLCLSVASRRPVFFVGELKGKIGTLLEPVIQCVTKDRDLEKAIRLSLADENSCASRITAQNRLIEQHSFLRVATTYAYTYYRLFHLKRAMNRYRAPQIVGSKQ